MSNAEEEEEEEKQSERLRAAGFSEKLLGSVRAFTAPEVRTAPF